jgi:FAD/FMN-containing dehydrogenase
MIQRTLSSVLAALRDTLGPSACIEDPGVMEPYLIEQRGLWHGECDMVVRPSSAEEVAAVLRICSESRTAVIPQGGNTGLLGGAVPRGGIVLSLAKMNRVRALDPLNHTITVEAGCILQTIQEAASEAGCLFPLSLGAEGSCQIGGNLATNAGGVNVLRYGNTRDLVLGIEAALPDGNIWNGLRGLRKDNTGYDLKHLFIGSEGTLGIITAAVLKLYPAPRAKETTFVAVRNPETMLDLFSRVRAACGDNLSAFEMVPRLGVELGCHHIAGVTDPMTAPHPFYALIELTSPRESESLRESLEAILEEALEAGIVEDAVIAASESQAKDLWRIRETIPEAQKSEGGLIKHDVAVPVSRVPEFVDRATALMTKELPGCRVVAFGHVGDGNIHFNISQAVGEDTSIFIAQSDRINRLVHDLVEGMDGTFSAEHGIGEVKRSDLARYKSPIEVNMMRGIKALFDPESIMNPGKVL